jgi:HEAT repeat protein
MILMGAASACGSQKQVDAAKAIAGFDPARGALDTSFARVDAAAETDPSATRAAAISRLSSSRAPEHFAAVYALGLIASASDRAQLHSLLHSPNVTERLLAAAALARLHDTDAIPPLIAALHSPTQVQYWAPAIPAWRFARLVLLERTGLDFGLRRASTLRAGRAAAVRWGRWWSANAGSFRFPNAESAP